MAVNAVKMYFISPLHSGRYGRGMENVDTVIHSDTLYSIIFQTWTKLYGVPEELPIKITSAFPFVKNLYYLPKPGLKAPGFEKDEIREEYAKKVKLASVVSFEIFENWIKGWEIDYEKMVEDQRLLSENIKINTRPRIAIDRLSSDTSLYFIGETVFRKEKAGLYFAVECEKEEWQKIKTIFSLLQEEGIGGERSLGYGKFRAEFVEDFRLPSAEDGDKYITLSLFCPANNEEIENAAVSYQLVLRSGWSIAGSEHFLQKRIFMFSEGSVFTKVVKGKIENVAPDKSPHPVYKYGKAFLVKAR
ncbi:MAG: type III-A CRISPR-associated RAMP protein Csm4 [Caldanaerobacter subterraneus]|nr:type III-A CRISPR-associated RAMP protein Csm4 [Caldanaerobacter subterraneus]